MIAYRAVAIVAITAFRHASLIRLHLLRKATFRMKFQTKFTLVCFTTNNTSVYHSYPWPFLPTFGHALFQNWFPILYLGAVVGDFVMERFLFCYFSVLIFFRYNFSCFVKAKTFQINFFQNFHDLHRIRMIFSLEDASLSKSWTVSLMKSMIPIKY